jgi:hypothetical protein
VKGFTFVNTAYEVFYDGDSATEASLVSTEDECHLQIQFHRRIGVAEVADRNILAEV